MQQGKGKAELMGEDELACWLALAQISGNGLSARRVRLICEYLESAVNAWQSGKEELKKIEGMNEEAINLFIARRKEMHPESLLAKVKEAGVAAYPIAHPYYPARLREIHDPPFVLYVKGDVIPSDMPGPVGVVGTRNPSAYGHGLAKEFARQLSLSGATVISGMAIGIDSLAHRGALEVKGRTVAVLGCAVDVCYPSSNKPLYKMLMEEPGCGVISEFFPGTKPEAWRFPARNRVISGMSQAVLVIEAGEQSGALITANLAFEQNREVFAVPGRIDMPMSAGTNKLIMHNKAHLVRSCQDLLDEMGWAPGATAREVPTIVELFGREKELYEMLSLEPVHFDFLCEQTGIPVGELSATLTMLELAGVIVRHPGDCYCRAR